MDANLHYQARFFTKEERYAIPDAPFSVPGSATPNDLRALINALLSECRGDYFWKPVNFDFLVDGELLNLSLHQHLTSKGVSPENVVVIEFLERCPAPQPEDSLTHDDWVSAVRAAGDWLLTGCYDNTLHIWTLSGEHKLTIPGHIAPVKAVAWISIEDPVSTFVSTSHDETAMIWQWNQRTNSVECVHVCRGHARSVDCVDVDSSQRKFATGSYDQMLKIWSTDLSMEDDTAEQSAASAAEGSRKRLKTEDGRTKNRTPIMTLAGHVEAITGVRWTDSNEVCTASMDNTLRLWDVELGGLKSQLTGTRAFLGISYSKLSRHLVAASADRHVRLYDPRTKEGSIVKCAFTSHTGWVTAVHWSPVDEHHFVSGSHDAVMKLWDVRSPKAPLYDMSGHEEKILCVDWSHPSYMISGGADNYVKMFQSKVSPSSVAMECSQLS